MRALDERAKLDVERPVDRDPNDAQRGTPERVRVGRAGRDEPDPEATDERVDAVGHGHRRRERVRW